jgi:hypothetical protein
MTARDGETHMEMFKEMVTLDSGTLAGAVAEWVTEQNMETSQETEKAFQNYSQNRELESQSTSSNSSKGYNYASNEEAACCDGHLSQ